MADVHLDNGLGSPLCGSNEALPRLTERTAEVTCLRCIGDVRFGMRAEREGKR